MFHMEEFCLKAFQHFSHQKTHGFHSVSLLWRKKKHLHGLTSDKYNIFFFKCHHGVKFLYKLYGYTNKTTILFQDRLSHFATSRRLWTVLLETRIAQLLH